MDRVIFPQLCDCLREPSTVEQGIFLTPRSTASSVSTTCPSPTDIPSTSSARNGRLVARCAIEPNQKRFHFPQCRFEIYVPTPPELFAIFHQRHKESGIWISWNASPQANHQLGLGHVHQRLFLHHSPWQRVQPFLFCGPENVIHSPKRRCARWNVGCSLILPPQPTRHRARNVINHASKKLFLSLASHVTSLVFR